jgi:drug/metabolite transporter (DMT)-like permease
VLQFALKFFRRGDGAHPFERLHLPGRVLLLQEVKEAGQVVGAIGDGWPELLVLAAAFCWSVAMILMRTISKSESALVQTLAINLCYALVMGVATAFTWQHMDAHMLALVVVTGLMGGVAQYVLVEAARLVPAGVLGTVEYSALIWAFIFGYLFWGEVPATSVYRGRR